MDRWVLRVVRRVLRVDRRVLRVGKRVLRVDKQILRVIRRVVQGLWVTRRVLRWCLPCTNVLFKGPLSGLMQLLTTGSSLKMLKNAFYFMLWVIFVLKIFTFLLWLFRHVGKRFDQKTEVDFKIYDVTGWTVSNYNTCIAQYLKK